MYLLGNGLNVTDISFTCGKAGKAQAILLEDVSRAYFQADRICEWVVSEISLIQM